MRQSYERRTRSDRPANVWGEWQTQIRYNRQTGLFNYSHVHVASAKATRMQTLVSWSYVFVWLDGNIAHTHTKAQHPMRDSVRSSQLCSRHNAQAIFHHISAGITSDGVNTVELFVYLWLRSIFEIETLMNETEILYTYKFVFLSNIVISCLHIVDRTKNIINLTELVITPNPVVFPLPNSFGHSQHRAMCRSFTVSYHLAMVSQSHQQYPPTNRAPMLQGRPSQQRRRRHTNREETGAHR